MSEVCIVMWAREKCASARVQEGVVSTYAITFLAVATVWTRNGLNQQILLKKRYKTRQAMRTHRLTLTTLNFSLTHAVPAAIGA